MFLIAVGEISWKARLANLCQYRNSRNQKCPLTMSLNEVNKSWRWILLSWGNSPLDAIFLSPGHQSTSHFLTNQKPEFGAPNQWGIALFLPPPVTARHSSVAPDWPRLDTNYSTSLLLCIAPLLYCIKLKPSSSSEWAHQKIKTFSSWSVLQ